MRVPSSARIIQLLNICGFLESQGRLWEAVQAVRLCGITLMHARRFVQAAEMFRKAEGMLFQLSPVTSDTYHQAARLELLAADALTQHSQLREKLAAYQKAAALFHRAQQPHAHDPGLFVVSRYADVSSHLLSLRQPLIDFLLCVLREPAAPLQHAALNALEFMLDAVGCSTGSQYCAVLNAVIASYPLRMQTQTQSPPMQQQQQHSASESGGVTPNDVETASVVDHFHRMLETCLDMMVHFSMSILAQVFHEAILPALLAADTHSHIAVHLLRFLSFIASRLGADLPVLPALLSRLVAFVTDRQTSLQAAGQRCWETLVQSQLASVAPSERRLLAEWAASALQQAMEQSGSEDTDTVTSLVVGLLSKVAAGCLQRGSSGAQYEALARVVPPLTRLLILQSISAPVDRFAGTWRCFQSVVLCLPADLQPDLGSVLLSILRPFHDHCLVSSPSPRMLELAQLLLDPLQPDETLTAFLVQLTAVFCQWVPHSVFDATFHLLQLLLRLVGQSMSPRVHIPQLLLSLLDPYTVKSSSQAKCVDAFIAVVLASSAESAGFPFLHAVLSTCLLDNEPPTEAESVDQRQQQLRHDVFVERLMFVRACVQQTVTAHGPVLAAHMPAIADSCRSLLRHPHSKVRLCVSDIMSFVTHKLHASHMLQYARPAATEAHSDSDDHSDSSTDAGSATLVASDYIVAFAQTALAVNDAELQLNCIIFLKQFAEMMSVSSDSPVAGRAMVTALWPAVLPVCDSPWRNVKAAVLWLLCGWARLAWCPVDDFNTVCLRLLAAADSDSRLYGLRLLASAIESRLGADAPAVAQAIAARVAELTDDWSTPVACAARLVASSCALSVPQPMQQSQSLQAAAAPPTRTRFVVPLATHTVAAGDSMQATTLAALRPATPVNKLWDAVAEHRLDDDGPFGDLVEVQQHQQQAMPHRLTARSGAALRNAEGFVSGLSEADEDNMTLDDLGIVDVEDDDLDIEDSAVDLRRRTRRADRDDEGVSVEQDAVTSGAFRMTRRPLAQHSKPAPDLARVPSPFTVRWARGVVRPPLSQSAAAAPRAAQAPSHAQTAADPRSGTRPATDARAASVCELPAGDVRSVYAPARSYYTGSGGGSDAITARMLRLAQWHDMAHRLSPGSVLTTESSSDGEAEYLYAADGDIDVLAEGGDLSFDENSGLPEGKIVRMTFAPASMVHPSHSHSDQDDDNTNSQHLEPADAIAAAAAATTASTPSDPRSARASLRHARVTDESLQLRYRQGARRAGSGQSTADVAEISASTDNGAEQVYGYRSLRSPGSSSHARGKTYEHVGSLRRAVRPHTQHHQQQQQQQQHNAHARRRVASAGPVRTTARYEPSRGVITLLVRDTPRSDELYDSSARSRPVDPIPAAADPSDDSMRRVRPVSATASRTLSHSGVDRWASLATATAEAVSASVADDLLLQRAIRQHSSPDVIQTPTDEPESTPTRRSQLPLAVAAASGSALADVPLSPLLQSHVGAPVTQQQHHNQQTVSFQLDASMDTPQSPPSVVRRRPKSAPAAPVQRHEAGEGDGATSSPSAQGSIFSDEGAFGDEICSADNDADAETPLSVDSAEVYSSDDPAPQAPLEHSDLNDSETVVDSSAIEVHVNHEQQILSDDDVVEDDAGDGVGGPHSVATRMMSSSDDSA